MGGSPVVGRRTALRADMERTQPTFGAPVVRAVTCPDIPACRVPTPAQPCAPAPAPARAVTRIHDEADRVRLHPIGCGHPDGRMPPPRWCPADGPDRPAVHPARRDPAGHGVRVERDHAHGRRMRRRPPPPKPGLVRRYFDQILGDTPSNGEPQFPGGGLHARDEPGTRGEQPVPVPGPARPLEPPQ